MSLAFIRKKWVTSPPPENKRQRELGEENGEMYLRIFLRWGIANRNVTDSSTELYWKK